MKHSSPRGFTIVELIIVVAVIAILAAATAIGYNGIRQSALDKSLLSDIESIQSEITRYSLKNGGDFDSALDWYSPNGTTGAMRFSPSGNNVVDVVTNGEAYCLRAYNPASSSKTVTTAQTAGSAPEACELIDASTQAGGSGGKVVGWWKLNGNALDSSGQGRNGTINGPTPTTGQNNAANGAYAFSTTAVQSINTNYNFPLANPSISMWINWAGAAQNSYGTLISNTRDSGGPYNGFQMHIAKSNSALGSRFWSGTTTASSMSYSTIPTGVWTHVALTYNGQTTVLYINGVQAKTAALTQALGSSAFNVFIGRGGWSNGYSFGGDIDDVRIYDYALSATTVKAIFDRGAL